MPAAASRAADLPAEFHGPVAYDDRWLWLALAGLVAVAAYYLAVLWFTRDRTAEVTGDRVDVPPARRLHLERIDRIEADVRAGRLSARAGHQELSETIRSYVAAVSVLPAPTMALADFRREARGAPGPLVDAIEWMYPPEFAPDGAGRARERFDDAVGRARRLVAGWSGWN